MTKTEKLAYSVCCDLRELARCSMTNKPDHYYGERVFTRNLAKVHGAIDILDICEPEMARRAMSILEAVDPGCIYYDQRVCDWAASAWL